MTTKPTYWFPAKRHGWGWGLPMTWQGWLVLASYMGLMLAAIVMLPPTRNAPDFLGIVVILTVCFLAICWAKGEPPRWRWGGRDLD